MATCPRPGQRLYSGLASRKVPFGGVRRANGETLVFRPSIPGFGHRPDRGLFFVFSTRVNARPEQGFDR